jgi:hypothetical protein
MHDPFISALYASDGRGTVELHQACAPGENPQRPVQVSLAPEGLSKVASLVKEEAQQVENAAIKIEATPANKTKGLPF